MEKYFVYILKSGHNNSYYVGSTTNLDERLKKHNMGMVKSTKSNVPWVLRYKEIYITLSDARKREIQIKHWKSRKAIERLLYGPIV